MFWMWFIRPLAEILGVIFAIFVLSGMLFGFVKTINFLSRRKK